MDEVLDELDFLLLPLRKGFHEEFGHTDGGDDRGDLPLVKEGEENFGKLVIRGEPLKVVDQDGGVYPDNLVLGQVSR